MKSKDEEDILSLQGLETLEGFYHNSNYLVVNDKH